MQLWGEIKHAKVGHTKLPRTYIFRAPVPAWSRRRRCYGVTRTPTEMTMADSQDRWTVRGVAPELQQQTAEVAAARGVTVGSIVTEALRAHLDALERGAGPVEPVVVEVPAASVPTLAPVRPCRRRAIWAVARGG